MWTWVQVYWLWLGYVLFLFGYLMECPGRDMFFCGTHVAVSFWLVHGSCLDPPIVHGAFAFFIYKSSQKAEQFMAYIILVGWSHMRYMDGLIWGIQAFWCRIQGRDAGLQIVRCWKHWTTSTRRTSLQTGHPDRKCEVGFRPDLSRRTAVLLRTWHYEASSTYLKCLARLGYR